MPDQRDAESILADWRAVKREIEAVRGMTDSVLLHRKLAALHAEARRLRIEYQALLRDMPNDRHSAGESTTPGE